MNMEIDDKYLSKHKVDYLILSLKICRMRYQGDEPSKKLLEQAYVSGSLAGISKTELQRLCFSQ
jgi:hypothetical protein